MRVRACGCSYVLVTIDSTSSSSLTQNDDEEQFVHKNRRGTEEQERTTWITELYTSTLGHDVTNRSRERDLIVMFELVRREQYNEMKNLEEQTREIDVED